MTQNADAHFPPALCELELPARQDANSDRSRHYVLLGHGNRSEPAADRIRPQAAEEQRPFAAVDRPNRTARLVTRCGLSARQCVRDVEQAVAGDIRVANPFMLKGSLNVSVSRSVPGSYTLKRGGRATRDGRRRQPSGRCQERQTYRGSPKHAAIVAGDTGGGLHAGPPQRPRSRSCPGFRRSLQPRCRLTEPLGGRIQHAIG